MSDSGDQLAQQVWLHLARIHVRATVPIDEDLWAAANQSEADPQRAASLTKYAPQYKIISFADEDTWELFDARMRQALSANSAPWHRILALLKTLKAKTCVVERNYVCLDFRSELATFYSQLDHGITGHSIRLHFFGTEIGSPGLFKLDETQKDSYLGYVVCRSGNLPLVGRTMLKVPSYVEISAAVDDTVYFFGQRLTVRGVPFLQQDDRFAVCAQVAAWEANYSAYRRGLVARSLIADFVTPTKGFRPMRPGGQRGLVAHQVADLFWEAGLRAEEWFTPRTGAPLLPYIDPLVSPEAVALAEESLDQLARLKVDTRSAFKADPTGEQSPRDFDDARRDLRSRVRFDGVGEMACDILALSQQFKDVPNEVYQLVDLVLSLVCIPYIRSRFPIYCDTQDHAILLCGISYEKSGPVFYFHDDQFGPYLASPTAFLASKRDFQFQSGAWTPPDALVERGFVNDLAPQVVDEWGVKGGDDQRGVHSIVVACPSRLLLGPLSAEADALRLARRSGFPESELRKRRVTMLMGTDYKDYRLSALSSSLSPEGQLYASMHLAEWVVVVEGLILQDGGATVRWEFVYDGTSGSDNPILQFARYGPDLVYVPPRLARQPQGRSRVARLEAQVQVLNLRGEPQVAPLEVPSRVGKGKTA